MSRATLDLPNGSRLVLHRREDLPPEDPAADLRAVRAEVADLLHALPPDALHAIAVLVRTAARFAAR